MNGIVVWFFLRIFFFISPFAAAALAFNDPLYAWFSVFISILLIHFMLWSVRKNPHEIKHIDSLSYEGNEFFSKYFHFYIYPSESARWSAIASKFYLVSIAVAAILAWNFGWLYIIPALPFCFWSGHLGYQFNPTPWLNKIGMQHVHEEIQNFLLDEFKQRQNLSVS